MAGGSISYSSTRNPNDRACRTCTRRKVKCDRTAGQCKRCQDAGFKCLGYEDSFAFVASRQQQLITPSYRRATVRPDTVQALPVVSQTATTPRELSLTPWTRDICVNFTLTTLFRQQRNGTSTQMTSPSWLELAAQRRRSSMAPTVDAVGALSTAYFGQQHRDMALLRRSMSMYNASLSSLNERLADSKLALSEDTLCDTMALIVYEMVIVTTPNGWIVHADGLEKLFELRGPHSFDGDLGLEIFHSSRPLIVMRHVLSRKSCILSLPQWQMENWWWHKQPYRPLYDIHGIMCVVPSLLAEADDLKKTVPSSKECQNRVVNLENKIQALIRRLFIWRLYWLSANDHTLQRISANNVTASKHPKLSVASHVWFDCLESANANTLYCATFITLWQIGIDISGPDFSVVEAYIGLDSSTAPYIGGTAKLVRPCGSNNAHLMALEICSMIEYHLLACHRGIGAFDLIYPVLVARRALNARPDLQSELSALLVWISEHESFTFGKQRFN